MKSVFTARGRADLVDATTMANAHGHTRMFASRWDCQDRLAVAPRTDRQRVGGETTMMSDDGHRQLKQQLAKNIRDGGQANAETPLPGQ
jgi:hypothetical protein